eukprot:3935777-Rhodomonas_salina.3
MGAVPAKRGAADLECGEGVEDGGREHSVPRGGRRAQVNVCQCTQGRREKGEGRRKKGEGRREKGEGRKGNQMQRVAQDGGGGSL